MQKKKNTIDFPFAKYLKHHPTWNTRASSYPILLRFVVPIASVLFIFLLKLQLEHFFQGDSPYLIFFAAIIINAWYGGFKTSFLATILSAIIIDYFFLKPIFSFSIYSINDYLKLTLFLLIGTLISILSQLMHNSLKKLEIKNLELKRREDYYRLIVETVKDYAIYTIDSDGYITSWNQGAERIKGYKTEEIIGKHFSIFYPQEDIKKGIPWKMLKIASKNGKLEDEGLKVKKDGSTFWADIVTTALKDEKGKIHGFSQITRDMTVHKELDRRKDEFITIASHELKTPLTSARVFNQILQKLLENRGITDLIPHLKKVENQIDKLNDIVNDLLDVSKIQAGKLEFRKEFFDLNNLVKEIVEDLQNTTKHIILIKGKSSRKLFADKDRIGQVLINFLTNAIKYSADTEKIIVKIVTEKNSITIGVQDFGLGIAGQHLEKIFLPFYRVQGEEGNTFPGLGMGLYISSDIIKRHSGRIWAESEKGKGSVFYFTLPLNKNE